MNFHQKFFGTNRTTHKEETKMTRIQKVLELIHTFATGDTGAARDLLAEGYIQHNQSGLRHWPQCLRRFCRIFGFGSC